MVCDRLFRWVCALCLLFSSWEGFAQDCWVGTWATAPQLVEPHNMPPAPGLSGNTLRQIVRVSIGGERVRLRLSNAFSDSALVVKSVTISSVTCKEKTSGNLFAEFCFGGKKGVKIEAGKEVFSDPLRFGLKSDSEVALTITYGDVPRKLTGHPGSRTTSYLFRGGRAEADKIDAAVKTDHWYTISALEVESSAAHAVAVIGNSITDGRGSGTNQQNRWTDVFSKSLLRNASTSHIGVLNLGIGGNCVLRGGLGPTASSRYERDILSQHGVKWVILFEAVNDLGSIPSAEQAGRTVEQLITAYREMIRKAKEKGLKVYGATITPFGRSFYDKDFRLAARDKLNHWIRTSGEFDAVIDFDAVMRDDSNLSVLKDGLHTGDYLHPNEKGYLLMGNSIDLNLFK